MFIQIGNIGINVDNIESVHFHTKETICIANDHVHVKMLITSDGKQVEHVFHSKQLNDFKSWWSLRADVYPVS